MNKFWTIFSHTFLTKVKAKSFIITTAIFIAAIMLMANIQDILSMFEDESNDKVAVLTEEVDIYGSLESQLNTTDSNIELLHFEGSMDEAQKDVANDTYVGVLQIKLTDSDLPQATYYSDNLSNQTVPNRLNQELEKIKVAMATSQAGLAPEVVETIYTPISFNTEPIDIGEQVKTEEELNSARGLVYVILFLLYIAVIMYGNMIATDIANEKTSRVMEILISSSSPLSQMFAKIFAIGSVGLVQMIIFLGVGYIMIQQKQEELTGGAFEFFGLSEASTSTFIYAIIFFLLGYFLYATLAAMLGSIVSRTEDVQQIMTPVIFLILGAFFISMFGLNAPQSQFVTITSYIPFFSPMVMFLRVGMLDIPFWEVGLSILILIVTIIIVGLIGARVYRGGVLLYGKSSSLKDFKRAFQLSKREQ